MSKSIIGRSRRDTAKRRISVDSIGSGPTSTMVSSSGSDTDSNSVSSLSSEDSMTKMMATSRIESDDEYDTGNNNYNNDPYDYRKSYSMPWKTTLQVSHSGRLKEKKKLRSPQHNCATVLDNEIFMPLDTTARHTTKERTVRFAV